MANQETAMTLAAMVKLLGDYEGLSAREASEIFGVHSETIRRVRRGESLTARHARELVKKAKLENELIDRMVEQTKAEEGKVIPGDENIRPSDDLLRKLGMLPEKG